MSEQDGRQATTVQRPSNEDLEAWKARGQSWRTEPEIDAERKKFLFSFKEFHGRGFFTEQSIPSALQTTAALEAFFGLFIEAGLISAFTQRFFGK